MHISDIEDMPDDSPPVKKSKPVSRKAAKQATKQAEEPKKKKKEREYYDFHLPQPPLAQPEKLWMTRKPEDFFDYFMSLREYWTPESEIENTQAQLRCYVYRKWPQIDNGMIGNRNSYIDRWHTWPFWDEGQAGLDEPVLIEDYKMGMLSKWGSGTYRVVLNDIIANKPIAELTEWVIRPENINSFPPVLNYKTLLMDVPENKNYITWRQQTGLPLPGELNEENMASPIQDKMLEKVFDKAFEDKPIPAATPPSTAAGDAAAVASVQLMANVVDRLMSKPEPVQQPAQSPNEAITLAVTLIEKLQPKGSDAVMEMLREDRENTRRENAELRKQLLDANRPKSLKEQLEELQALKELMGSGSGSRPVFKRPEEPSFLDKHGATILQLGTALLGAWMQGMKPPQVVDAQPQPQQPQQPQQSQPQQPQPQQPAQSPKEGESEVSMMIRMIQQYLDTIALPLFNHLKDHEGEDFADWLIGGYGEDAYKQAAGLEFSLLLDAISTHPIIGKLIEENKIPIERLATFIEHFKNPEKYWTEEEEETEEAGNVVQMPPQAS